MGHRAGKLERANQRGEDRLRYLSVRIGKQRCDEGNDATELSGERVPRRLRMSPDFRPERRCRTALLGMFTMARPEVKANEALDPALLGGLDNPCKGLLHPRLDDFLNKRLLRGEVAVEAAVSQSSVPHQGRHTNAVQTLFTKARRSHFHNPTVGVFFMVSSIAHPFEKILLHYLHNIIELPVKQAKLSMHLFHETVDLRAGVARPADEEAPKEDRFFLP
jgi:hypothetical protein